MEARRRLPLAGFARTATKIDPPFGVGSVRFVHWDTSRAKCGCVRTGSACAGPVDFCGNANLEEDEETGAKRFRYIKAGGENQYSFAFTCACMALDLLWPKGAKYFEALDLRPRRDDW